MTDKEEIPVQAAQTAPDSHQSGSPEADTDENECCSPEEYARMVAQHEADEAAHPEWAAGREECDAIIREAMPKFELALDLACRMDKIAERLRECELDLSPVGVGMCVEPPKRIPFASDEDKMAECGNTLAVNARFVNMHTPEFLAVILLHEAWHLELDHFALSRRVLEQLEHRAPRNVLHLLFNAAEDLEINSKLAPFFQACGETDNSLMPGDGVFADIPAGLTAEAYMEMILSTPAIRDAVLSYGDLGEAQIQAGREAFLRYDGV
jgi:hypothetical protein